MDSFKQYIIRIIVLCAVVQLGSVLITNDGFKRVYKLAGSIMLMISFLSLPSCNTKLDFDFIEQNKTVSTDDLLNGEFTDRVEKMISDDLKENFKLQFFRVEVTSDYSSINISVYGYFTNDEIATVENYIKNKYCTSEDEVMVKNELH